jgi:hypothetical protein
MLWPRASDICDATVRFQTRSYNLSSSALSSRATCSGVRKLSPAGRIASCASCAFFTLRLYWRGCSGTYSAPYNLRA